MDILIAPTRFLPNVGSQAVADALERGIRQCRCASRVLVRPVPEGGRGTIDIVVRALSGRIRRSHTWNAAGREVDSRWVLLPDGSAMIDAAEILGASEVPDVMRASSWGLGPLIMDVMRYHPRQIIITLGDVMVHDGGMGLLEYFGLRFVDEQGADVPRGLRGLERVHHITQTELHIPPVPLVMLYPRALPLTGKEGVTFTDGSVKGLSPYQLPVIDLQMQHYAQLLEEFFSTPLLDQPGTGEGGGLGLALLGMGAQSRAAADYLLDLLHLDTYWANVQWVLTAQMTLDKTQNLSLVATLSRRLAPLAIPLVAIVERLGDQYMQFYNQALKGIYPLVDKPRSAREVERMRIHLLEQAAFRIAMWMAS
ncbi:hypothetical protein BFX06_07510 [Sulfobacillus thermosulfidooxidans]|uniref:glycerate kinase n=3 Tax=Sulfobacillus thermosulfidooxidans TaxID=28034 RepID=UPI000420B02C|nr:glycerate kinase [Sulfobacillus thermosulfidooxidans]OLZ14138.1 hypothetical protein BFX06_07510 [Sulfobacillus thermosulfidooxidans]OLZ18881.1 hypothetical protein BFX07_03905 [Sulfobacillus thermosulfidooxidans]